MFQGEILCMKKYWYMYVLSPGSTTVSEWHFVKVLGVFGVLQGRPGADRYK